MKLDSNLVPAVLVQAGTQHQPRTPPQQAEAGAGGFIFGFIVAIISFVALLMRQTKNRCNQEKQKKEAPTKHFQQQKSQAATSIINNKAEGTHKSVDAKPGKATITKQELIDYNKPELTTSQAEAIEAAISQAVEQFDFDDTENYEIDYSLDYDGRVQCETHEFINGDDLVMEIVTKVCNLFKEVEDEPTANQLNKAQ